ncbi:2-phospho-L-lactate transferase CofD family protein [Brevibacterium litoralis]|uniref:2-phospho-L-lactate transferase CofD family protein n=1 Tax=Brevibacterium litoralis TaxID=3138935 RepID=UPI0032EB286F
MKITVLPLTDSTSDVLADVRAVTGDLDDVDLTVVASTLTDVTVHGLRFSPDLDACFLPPSMPVSGGAVSELRDYHVDAEWFTMTERTLAAAILRTRLLGLGYPLSQVTKAMSSRFDLDYTLLPLSDQAVETFVVVRTGTQEEAWPARRYLENPVPDVVRIARTGFDEAKAAPGVLAAVRQADVLVVHADHYAAFDTVPAFDLPGMTEAVAGSKSTVLTLGAKFLPDTLREKIGGREVEDLEAALAELAGSADSTDASGADGGSGIWAPPASGPRA